jgi:hypothetical protein
MTRRTVTTAAVLLFGSMFWLWAASHSVEACNKTAGCAMDTLEESHDMMRDGRMIAAMAAARANVEAFRALREAEERMVARPARKTATAPR